MARTSTRSTSPDVTTQGPGARGLTARPPPHGEVFGAVKPTSALYVIAGFAHPDMLVEVEVEAYKP